MAKTFILSQEGVNDKGTRILTAGINLERFLKNPIMLYMHRRDDGWDFEGVRPIGIWENVRKEDGKLLADPKFDENDTFAKLIKSKVEDGFLRGASVGISPVEFSTDEKHLEKGQTRATVTKCELYEASIVDMPSNKHTVSLFSRNDDKDSEIPLLNNSTKMAKKQETDQITFKDEAEMLSFMKEKFGLEPKEEKPTEDPKQESFSFKNEEESVNWFQKMFGLKPKAKTEEKTEKPTEDHSSKGTEELSDDQKEIARLKAENLALQKGDGEEFKTPQQKSDGSSSSEKNDTFGTYASAKETWDAVNGLID